MTKILVCDPTYYTISYEINPWMSIENQSNQKLAIKQWFDLVDILKKIGVTVLTMPGQSDLPDMVFTANAGVFFKKHNQIMLANFKCPERQAEKNHYRNWFEENNIKTIELAPEFYFEGAGDGLFKEQSSEENSDNTLYLGHGFRSDYGSITHPIWKDVWSESTCYIQLVDPYFYHLDTCFCPLKDNFSLIWTGAFDEDTVKSLECHLKLIKVPKEDAVKFACNAIAVDNKVIIPAGCEQTKQLLMDAGFEVFDTNMSEFIKAGGACKCLTLRLE